MTKKIEKEEKLSPELERLSKTFHNNQSLFLALKQLMINDVINAKNSPIIAQTGIPDLWAIDLNKSPELVKLDVLAKQEFIKHIENCLISLWQISKSDFNLWGKVEHLSRDEVKEIFKGSFSGEEDIKDLRYIFYPENSRKSKLGDFVKATLQDEELDKITPNELYTLMRARNYVMGRVETALQVINNLIIPEKSELEISNAIKADSGE